MAILSFGNLLGFLGFLSLVPFLILYLIKPKPKLMEIPSLMFFIKTTGANKITSFFKYFTKDFLFFLQLALLIFLAFVLTQPFTDYMHDLTAQNTVIVIDASGSSQALEGGSTRFSLEIKKALDSLGKRTSIIVAKMDPFLGVKDGTSSEARTFLKTLQPLATPTRLGEAIMLAGETLGGKEGRVIVLSDFINTHGQDAETAKSILQSKGIVVDFINVGTKDKSNVGIIDLIVEEDSTTSYIKNYDKEQRIIKAKVGDLSKELKIAAGSVEPFVFQTPSGISKLEIDAKDDFSLDNTAYISAPEKTRINALLITNNQSVFITNALKASGIVNLTIAVPPVVPKDKFELYVIQDVKPSEVLTGTFEGILEKVEQGSSLIIQAQEKQEKLDLKGLLPLKIQGNGDRSSLTVQQVNSFTKNMDFGTVDTYYIAKSEDMLSIVTAGESPIIAYGNKGLGKILYYGILEKSSDFKFTPNYPIFWTELVKFLTEKEDVKRLNQKTGSMLNLDKEFVIKTPARTIKQKSLILEEQGIYTVGERKIAVNLLSEFESSINAGESFGQKSTEAKLESVSEKRKYPLEIILIMLALGIVLFEIFYIKKRGDL